MPGMAADEMPSVEFLARYLADAAKQQLPARGVATVLQSYVDRGLPADRIAQAVSLAREAVAEPLRPLLDEYAKHVDGAC